MKIEAQYYNDVAVVELKGELDMDMAEPFKQCIYEVVTKAHVGVVVDMTEVTFVDSVGLEQLLWARDYCQDNNRQLRLAGLGWNLKTILEVTRLKGEFEEYEELSKAVKSFV